MEQFLHIFEVTMERARLLLVLVTDSSTSLGYDRKDGTLEQTQCCSLRAS